MKNTSRLRFSRLQKLPTTATLRVCVCGCVCLCVFCLQLVSEALPRAEGVDVELSGHYPCPCSAGRRELSGTSSYLAMLLQLRKRRCKQGRRSTSVWKEKEKEGEGRERDGGM